MLLYLCVRKCRNFSHGWFTVRFIVGKKHSPFPVGLAKQITLFFHIHARMGKENFVDEANAICCYRRAFILTEREHVGELGI